jgi:hypothetical protein
MLTVNGSGFTAGSGSLNGTALSTTFVSTVADADRAGLIASQGQ